MTTDSGSVEEPIDSENDEGKGYELRAKRVMDRTGRPCDFATIAYDTRE